MKKDYSKIFSHYYGLQYDGHVVEMIKIHQLMEDAGIQVSGSTASKLEAYSDKRPFRVNYFISKVGKTLKWCPTSSPEKFAKMTLMPIEWWFEQLTDLVEVKPIATIPDNWIDAQKIAVRSMTFPKTIAPGGNHWKDDIVEAYNTVEVEDYDDTLPF